MLKSTEAVKLTEGVTVGEDGIMYARLYMVGAPVVDSDGLTTNYVVLSERGEDRYAHPCHPCPVHNFHVTEFNPLVKDFCAGATDDAGLMDKLGFEITERDVTKDE